MKWQKIKIRKTLKNISFSQLLLHILSVNNINIAIKISVMNLNKIFMKNYGFVFQEQILFEIICQHCLNYRRS